MSAPRREQPETPSHLEPTTTLLVKLASVVVHADELTGPGGRGVDFDVLRQCLEDDDVVEWVRAMTADGLAPVKR